MGYHDDYVTRASTEQAVIDNAIAHGKAKHGLKEIDLTSELKDKIKSKIQPVQS